MNDLSLSSSPQFFSVISWKVFLCRKNPPPQLPFSAHKKQVEKKKNGLSGGGGGVDGET